MERQGKTLKTLEDGDRRRLSDMKNGWRKASEGQRAQFLDWIRFEDDSPQSNVLVYVINNPEEPVA